MDKEPIEELNLGKLLALALMSGDNAVVARARVGGEIDAQILFVVQVVEITRDGVTESLIDDMEMPPKDQLN